MREEIEKADNAFSLYMMCNKPYALTFLKFAEHHLSREDFSNILSDAWIRSENPNEDPNVDTEKLVSMFKNADRDILMDEDELNELELLDGEVTVYRGVTPYNKKTLKQCRGHFHMKRRLGLQIVSNRTERYIRQL